MISINTPKRFDRINPSIKKDLILDSFKDTLKSFASYTMVASTVLLMTATIVGAVVASLDDDEDNQENEPEGEQE